MPSLSPRPGCWLGIFVTLAALVYATEHAIYVAVTVPDALPVGVFGAWVANWAWYPMLGAMFVFFPLLFPTGRPPSSRWRVVAWTGGCGSGHGHRQCCLAETLLLGRDANLGVHSLRNPIGVQGLRAEGGVVFDMASLVLVAATVAAIVSLVVRYRHSRGDEASTVEVVRVRGCVRAGRRAG